MDARASRNADAIGELRAHLERRGAVWAVGALMLLCAVMYRGVFRGELAGDDLTFHLAETARIADCLSAGDFDLWNPSANAGFASAYYYQVVPQLVPAALTALTGHLLFWFQLCVFLPLVLAPLAAYRGLRVLGTSPWSAVGGALAVVMCMSNSRWGHGADGTFSVGLYTQTWAFAAFPLPLGYGARWLTDGRHLGRATAWGLFVGLCHPFAGVAVGLALAVGCVLPRAIAALLRPLTVALASRWPWLGPLARADDAPERPGWPRASTLVLRLALLGTLLLVGSASAWLPVLVDYAGFGGFPHRVADEIGPGLVGLLAQVSAGDVLDHGRPPVLTLLVPVVLIAVRGRSLAWLWSGAAIYVAILAAGPLLVTPDDLFPAVRMLGPLQIVLALAAGVGAVEIGSAICRPVEAWRYPVVVGTAVASVAVAATILLVLPGSQRQFRRVRVASDFAYVHRAELTAIIDALATEPDGRKQARNGTENHWSNLLPYVYARRPALLQMGGAGLQASPNYGFIWQEGDPVRSAWIFDAPLVLVARDQADKLPAGDTVVETDHLIVRRFPSPGLVSPVEITGTLPSGRFAARKAALEWLASPEPMRSRVLAYPPNPPSSISGEPRGRAATTTRQASPGDEPDIVAEVVAYAPAVFVIRESWHPRWRGFLDGKPAPLRRVTPDFPAIDVPEGQHTIALRFDRPWWAWASWLLIPLCVLAGAVLCRRWRG